MVVEGLPNGLSICRGTPSRTEQWNMPIRQSTEILMRIQICFQPLQLRSGRATSTRISTIGVDSDDVPRTNIIAVIALSLNTSSRSKIIEVACCSCIGTITTSARSAWIRRSDVLVISNDWVRDCLNTTPTEIIRLLEGLQPSTIVLHVSKRQNRCQT